jgi:hypothetical protein
MVMFRNIPYHVVKRRGEQQEVLLERLIGPANKLAEIDLPAAETAAKKELAPIAAEPSF